MSIKKWSESNRDRERGESQNTWVFSYSPFSGSLAVDKYKADVRKFLLILVRAYLFLGGREREREREREGSMGGKGENSGANGVSERSMEEGRRQEEAAASVDHGSSDSRGCCFGLSVHFLQKVRHTTPCSVLFLPN